MKARNPLRLLLLITTLALASAGCSVSDTATVRTLDDLPGGFEGPDVVDVGPHSARVLFRSGEPIVCNIAYGASRGYGRLTLMAMTGPLTDHDVQILGLEPETSYHFRITVTDREANVYQSGDYSFTTAVGDDARKPSGRNVASVEAGARIVGVSSNWASGDLDSSFGGNNAIDGNSASEWSSDGDGDSAWIEIELAQVFDVRAIGFWTRTMGASAQVLTFTVLADGGERFGPFELPDAATMYVFDMAARTQKLRFEVDASSGGNTGAVEIEVYANDE
jgi:hypothetical protein